MPNTTKPTKAALLEIAHDIVSHDEHSGLCHACGHVQAACEPDARNYKCDNCGMTKVFGAEETLFMLA